MYLFIFLTSPPLTLLVLLGLAIGVFFIILSLSKLIKIPDFGPPTQGIPPPPPGCNNPGTDPDFEVVLIDDGSEINPGNTNSFNWNFHLIPDSGNGVAVSDYQVTFVLNDNIEQVSPYDIIGNAYICKVAGTAPANYTVPVDIPYAIKIATGQEYGVKVIHQYKTNPRDRVPPTDVDEPRM